MIFILYLYRLQIAAISVYLVIVVIASNVTNLGNQCNLLQNCNNALGYIIKNIMTYT